MAEAEIRGREFMFVNIYALNNGKDREVLIGLAIRLTRCHMKKDNWPTDPLTLFRGRVSVCLRVEFAYFQMTILHASFENMWCHGRALCLVILV